MHCKLNNVHQELMSGEAAKTQVRHQYLTVSIPSTTTMVYNKSKWCLFYLCLRNQYDVIMRSCLWWLQRTVLLITADNLWGHTHLRGKVTSSLILSRQMKFAKENLLRWTMSTRGRRHTDNCFVASQWSLHREQYLRAPREKGRFSALCPLELDIYVSTNIP